MGIRVTVTRISATLGLTRNGGGWPCLVPLGQRLAYPIWSLSPAPWEPLEVTLRVHGH